MSYTLDLKFQRKRHIKYYELGLSSLSADAESTEGIFSTQTTEPCLTANQNNHHPVVTSSFASPFTRFSHILLTYQHEIFLHITGTPAMACCGSSSSHMARTHIGTLCYICISNQECWANLNCSQWLRHWPMVLFNKGIPPWIAWLRWVYLLTLHLRLMARNYISQRISLLY